MGGQPGSVFGEHDEGVEEVLSVFGGGGEVAADAQNCLAPVRVRRHPDIFCRNLIIRMSRSVPLLSGGIRQLMVKRR